MGTQALPGANNDKDNSFSKDEKDMVDMLPSGQPAGKFSTKLSKLYNPIFWVTKFITLGLDAKYELEYNDDGVPVIKMKQAKDVASVSC